MITIIIALVKYCQKIAKENDLRYPLVFSDFYHICESIFLSGKTLQGKLKNSKVKNCTVKTNLSFCAMHPKLLNSSLVRAEMLFSCSNSRDAYLLNAFFLQI